MKTSTRERERGTSLLATRSLLEDLALASMTPGRHFEVDTRRLVARAKVCLAAFPKLDQEGRIVDEREEWKAHAR